jgi:phosphopentomutase
MGGHFDLSLSCHRRDDQQYNNKRKELRQYIPELEHHLQALSIIIILFIFSKHSLSPKSQF